MTLDRTDETKCSQAKVNVIAPEGIALIESFIVCDRSKQHNTGNRPQSVQPYLFFVRYEIEVVRYKGTVCSMFCLNLQNNLKCIKITTLFAYLHYKNITN